MNYQQIIILVIGALFVGGLGVCFYLGKDYLKYHNIFAPVLKGLVSAAKALSGAVPDNQTLKTIAFVMNAALDGAQRAEELWLNGELDKEQRNHYAKLYIADVLEKAGIDVNDSINAMIDGFIAVACAIFPHGQTPKTKEEEK